MIGVMRYYLGLGGNKPEFKRFTYAEKAEYWALVWGVFVMAATGIALWAKVSVGHLLPRWWLDVATAVHFYEADPGHARHRRLALLPDLPRSRRLSHELGLVGRQGVRASLPEEHGLDSETLLAAAAAESASIDGCSGRRGNGTGTPHVSLHKRTMELSATVDRRSAETLSASSDADATSRI